MSGKTLSVMAPSDEVSTSLSPPRMTFMAASWALSFSVTKASWKGSVAATVARPSATLCCTIRVMAPDSRLMSPGRTSATLPLMSSDSDTRSTMRSLVAAMTSGSEATPATMVPQPLAVSTVWCAQKVTPPTRMARQASSQKRAARMERGVVRRAVVTSPVDTSDICLLLVVLRSRLAEYPAFA